MARQVLNEKLSEPFNADGMLTWCSQRTVMLYRPSADELRVEYRYLSTAEPVSTLTMAHDNSSLPLVSSTIYRNDLVLLPPAIRAAITELTQTGQQPSHKVGRLEFLKCIPSC